MPASIQILASKILLSQGSRPCQEDFVLADPDKGIFVLADGFGGPYPGSTAAKAACDAVRRFLFKEAGDEEATMPFVLRSYFSLAGNVLFNALIHANRKIQKINHKKNIHEKGGASVVAGFLDGDLLALANVGACSAMLLRKGERQELVSPRCYSRLADPFTTGGSAGGSDLVDAPLIALGMADDLEPEIFEYRLKPGDWLILFSDGVDAGFFAQASFIQQKNLSPETALAEVQQLFDTRFFKDNASISLSIL